MRNEDRDSTEFGWTLPARCRSIALEERMLCLSVQRSGWFVEHQQKRLIPHKTTCQRELLPLAE